MSEGNRNLSDTEVRDTPQLKQEEAEVKPQKGPTPWHALGVGAGLLSAVLLSLAESLLLLRLPNPPLESPADWVGFGSKAFAVYSSLTIPIGLGFGLIVLGLSRWLDLPQSWRRLKQDDQLRARFEPEWASVVVLLPLMVVSLGGFAFAIQKLFVRNMNNPTLGAAFLALFVMIATVLALAVLPLGLTLLRWLLPRLQVHRLAREEPRLLKTWLILVGLFAGAVFGLLFLRFWDPLVWSLGWVVFLFAIFGLPLVLTFSGPLVRWCALLRHPLVTLATLTAFSAASFWAYASMAPEGEELNLASEAMLYDSTFTPTILRLVQHATEGSQSAHLWDATDDDEDEQLADEELEEPNLTAHQHSTPNDTTDPQAAANHQEEDPSLESGPSEREQSASELTRLQDEDTLEEEDAPEELDTNPRRNIVIIMVDTLRPDHLGFYGYERPISANMDAFASESVSFDFAYAQAPHTPRSIPSIFVSRMPSDIAFNRPGSNYPNLRSNNLTFFEVLQELGYYNLAVSSHYYFEPRRGMAQGFDHWDNRGSTSISETNDAITAPDIFRHLNEHLPTLQNLEQPFCLFIHYFEPHARWLPHPDVIDFGRATGRQRHINNYDSEIAFVDLYVGHTLDLLRQNDWYDDSIIVLLSDHGEAFNEHGHYFHGQTLYEEEIRVVLFIKAPGFSPQRVSTPVALLDVGPTLVDLLGGQVPDAFQGRALFGLLPSPEVVDIYSELLPYSNYQQHFTALIRDRLKIIYHVNRRRYELYDLALDPGETNNIYRTSERASEMREALSDWMQR